MIQVPCLGLFCDNDDCTLSLTVLHFSISNCVLFLYARLKSTIYLFYCTFMMFQCMNTTDTMVILSLCVEVQCDVRWVSLSSGGSLVCLWLSGSHLLLHHQEALQSTMSPTVRTGAPEHEALACSLAEVSCLSTFKMSSFKWIVHPKMLFFLLLTTKEDILK